MRTVTVDFDLGVSFEIEDGVDLSAAAINAEIQSTSLSDFITAYKCNGLGSAEDSSALELNTERAIIPKPIQTAVNLARLEHEATPLAE